jgi:soluble lytic murein transglycosylase-like protein
VATTYKDEIAAASKASGVPKDILAGMIWQESKGRPVPGGGLMQVQPNEFASEGGGDINDPATNIMAGAMKMREMIDRFGDVPTALRGYNSGENGVDPNDLHATPAGTGDPNYVDLVLDAARKSRG